MEEIKKLIGSEKLIIGQDETLKAARKGELKKVFLALNVSKEIQDDIEYYAKIAGFKVEKLSKNSEDIGIFLKKPYFISVLSEKK